MFDVPLGHSVNILDLFNEVVPHCRNQLALLLQALIKDILFAILLNDIINDILLSGAHLFEAETLCMDLLLFFLCLISSFLGFFSLIAEVLLKNACKGIGSLIFVNSALFHQMMLFREILDILLDRVLYGLPQSVHFRVVIFQGNLAFHLFLTSCQ